MTTEFAGQPTHHTRVESWETDFNRHWNTRFYSRSFQMAAEAVAALAGQENRGVEQVTSRHVRFHGEVFEGAAVEVRSAAVVGGAFDGAIVHFLVDSGRLAATALDLPGTGSRVLPVISADELTLALPRSLGGAPPLIREDPSSGLEIHAAETGTVRRADTDHLDQLLFEELIKHCALGSHHHVIRLGLSPEYTRSHGIGRMLAEMRVTLIGTAKVGDQLRVLSRLTTLGEKSFITAHRIETRAGEPIAVIEMCSLAVDMQARKVTAIPSDLQGTMR